MHSFRGRSKVRIKMTKNRTGNEKSLGLVVPPEKECHQQCEMEGSRKDSVECFRKEKCN